MSLLKKLNKTVVFGSSWTRDRWCIPEFGKSNLAAARRRRVPSVIQLSSTETYLMCFRPVV